jgi:hypothetical protein
MATQRHQPCSICYFGRKFGGNHSICPDRDPFPVPALVDGSMQVVLALSRVDPDPLTRTAATIQSAQFRSDAVRTVRSRLASESTYTYLV